MMKLFQSELFWEIFIGLLSWFISFLIISWLVEGSFWLHFFLSSSGSYFFINSIKRQITEKLIPIFQNLDDNINSLHCKSQFLEEELDSLKERIDELESRINDVEDKIEPGNYHDNI